MPFLSFFTSKLGLTMISIMGVCLTIWGVVSAAKSYWEDTRANIRASVTNEVLAEARQEAIEDMGEALQTLQDNQARQNELIADLATREASRNRALDRISTAVQQTIIEQGGEQPASPALRQSAQLLAEEWDRLYGHEVELVDAPAAP